MKPPRTLLLYCVRVSVPFLLTLSFHWRKRTNVLGGAFKLYCPVPMPPFVCMYDDSIPIRPYAHFSLIFFFPGSDRLSTTSKDREERVRRIREQQEEERRRKLEELKQHVST